MLAILDSSNGSCAVFSIEPAKSEYQVPSFKPEPQCNVPSYLPQSPRNKAASLPVKLGFVRLQPSCSYSANHQPASLQKVLNLMIPWTLFRGTQLMKIQLKEAPTRRQDF